MSLHPYKVNESSFCYGMWWMKTFVEKKDWRDIDRRLAIVMKWEHARQIMVKGGR